MKQIKPSEINRTIAEILEPKPVHICGQYIGCSELADMYDPRNCPACLHRGLNDAPLKYWLWRGSEREGFQPLDFLHDPRGTVMLMENLLRKGWLAGFIADNPLSGPAVFNLTSPQNTDCFHRNLSEAVAYAFLRANNYEVNE